MYAYPDLKYDIIYLHGIWLLVRTIAHDLHASVVVASYIIHNNTFTKSSDILNKNSLAVKKCEANQKQDYKRPKHLISRKAKKTKLCIPTSWPSLISDVLFVYNFASDWPRTFLQPGCFCLGNNYIKQINYGT